MILNRKILTILALLSILLIIPASFAAQDIDGHESQDISSEDDVTLETSDVTNRLNENNQIYVNSTGSDSGSGTADNPVKTIQEGLNLVGDGGTIYLTGKFSGNGNCNFTFKGSPDQITFIGVGNTTIDGDPSNTFAVVKNGTYTFRNIIFKNHYKTGEEDEFGGVFANEKGKLTFYSCSFENNTVYGVNTGNGGAIDNAGQLTIVGCSFVNNKADNSNSSGFRKNAADGGAISNVGELYISDTSFTSNKALRNGGALRIQESRSTIIRNCNFTNNLAAYHLSGGSFGGAIYSWDCGMSIYNSIFKDNRVYAVSGSGAQGGAISSDRSSDNINIRSCQFINNTADGTTTVSGQCFYFGSVDVDMNYCTIDTGLYSASQSVNLNYNWWDSNNIYDLIENLPSTTGISNFAELVVTSDGKDIMAGDLLNITVKLRWSDTGNQDNINLIPQRTVYLNSNCGVLGDTTGDLIDGEFKTTLKLNTINNAAVTATVGNVVYKLDLSRTTNPTKFNVTNVEIVKGENAVIDINAEKNESGFCLIDVDGATYYSELVNGQAKASIPNLDVGNYDVFIKYVRNDFTNPYNATSSIIVKNNVPDTNIVVSSKFTCLASDTGAGEKGNYLYATLKDSEGNLLANKTVQIALNGKLHNITTNNQGKAGLQISLAKANTYTCAFAFQGDDNYHASPLVLSKITVNKKTTSISVTSKAKKVSVTLKTSKNKNDGKTYLKKGKKITLKVNGKTYSGKTNSKGVAKFTVKITKKGTYTAKVKFAGDDTYKSSSKTMKITIK